MSFHLSSVIRRKLAIIPAWAVWPPSFPLRIVASDYATRQPWQRRFLGTLAELVVIVIWLGFRLHAFTSKVVAFLLPQFTCPSASSVHFQCRTASVGSDWFYGLTWSTILSFHFFRGICRNITWIQPCGNYRTGIFTVTSISLYCTRISIQSSLKLYHCQSKHLIQARMRHPTETRITCSCCWAAKHCPNAVVDSGSALAPIFGRLKMTPAVGSSVAGYC